MVIDFILLLLYSILGGLAIALPHFSIWPASILNAITYLINSLAIANFIFPIDTLFYCVNLFIGFLILYYGTKLLVSIFNWLRGSGEIKI
ncbi:hypothetical protein Indivirus_18_2 [Indivirus ILV1]|uniref:Uncharacterized protein n=1 Tax=Indivirus ILV1 TaxID=1977633 RepID=A0A1V0SEP8_9VIRU|nr:hypothetical protein Indivirus_18_2 [Indivirus ILV1]